ncbi:hypothetical protein GCM10010121_080900 [Streptomyces brasiliensis]|uniref:Uncharacterized protein n=1 Tax=Streptomyces brasiliensis TaxID=1954 RepID=A0A917LC84_9ACTN|nr:hypothetical protein GCM10010121_080900 [Streptomyces brasiliensis]
MTWVIFGRKLAVSCRWKSGPGSCQEAREQTGGVGGKRSASKPSVESPARGSKAAVRSITRSLRRRWRPASRGGDRGCRAPEIRAKAMEAAKILEMQR